MEASLYVHVPFCAYGKCDYCDFYSVPVKPGDPRLELYVKTVLSEGERLLKKYHVKRIPTVFIGGGTPSILGPVLAGSLLSGLLELVIRYAPPPCEITIEANPESADEAFLASIREKGVTRLSLGIQTFHGPSRRAVHRGGAESTAELSDDSLLKKRLALALEYFPGAFSCDLISAFPFQNETVLLDDIATLLNYKPAHVSLYALTVEPGTPLEEKALSFSGEPFLPGGDEADRLWLRGRDTLEKSGYAQYEVSNFCLKGKESRHNIRYWRMQNWLALGPAASGTIIDDETGTGLRYTIPPDLNPWLSAEGCVFDNKSGLAPVHEALDVLTLMKETFLMGFRYIEGPDEDLFMRRFRRNIESCIPKTIGAWRNRGLARKDKCALTKEGLLFLNPFLLDALAELDAANIYLV
jgi:oxygen-independent coproporphyrinogen-3 oxidase